LSLHFVQKSSWKYLMLFCKTSVPFKEHLFSLKIPEIK
jgi:hypothetical protein